MRRMCHRRLWCTLICIGKLGMLRLSCMYLRKSLDLSLSNLCGLLERNMPRMLRSLWQGSLCMLRDKILRGRLRLECRSLGRDRSSLCGIEWSCTSG